jgi:hypothetical protein
MEKSGGQFWKRLRSTKDCNAGRIRRKKDIYIVVIATRYNSTN